MKKGPRAPRRPRDAAPRRISGRKSAVRRRSGPRHHDVLRTNGHETRGCRRNPATSCNLSRGGPQNAMMSQESCDIIAPPRSDGEGEDIAGAPPARRPASARRPEARPTRGQPHETCTGRRVPGCSCKRHASLGPGGASTLPPPGDLWRFRKADAQVGEPWAQGPMDIYVHRPLSAAISADAWQTIS